MSYILKVYDRCQYKGCSNTKNDTILYRFPKYGSVKCEMWLDNCGNANLRNWKPSSLARAGICRDHFTTSDFIVKWPQRLKRHPNVEPIPYIEQSVIASNISKDSSNIVPMPSTSPMHTPHAVEQMISTVHDGPNSQWNVGNLRTYSKGQCHFNVAAIDENPNDWISIEPHSTITNESVELPANETRVLSNEIERLKNYAASLEKKLQERTMNLSNASKSGSSSKTIMKEGKEKIMEIADLMNLPQKSKTLSGLQLHIPSAPYTPEEKNYSKKIFFTSPAAWRAMRQSGAMLPAPSTIRTWLLECDIKPGFCDNIFQKVGEKLKSLSLRQRMCALKWDETTIEKYEEYSIKFDEIEGLADLGHLGRENEQATSIFVFCLDSLDAENPWRQPLAYFLSRGPIPGNVIVSLIHSCLDKLLAIGADVRALVCDQGTPNQNAYKLLGVDEHTSSFTYNDKKYFSVFDFPHLIKRLLSFLRNHRTLYDDKGIVASWDDYVATWEIDRNTIGGSNLLSHITERHLRPDNFEAMNVKRAFQMLSRRYAAAMAVASTTMNSSTCQKTAKFTEYMDTIIDACNTYSLKISVGGKRVLSGDNQDVVDRVKKFIKYASVLSKKGDEWVQLPFMKGLQLTALSITDLYDDLKTQYPGFRLATGLCNQNSVEHLFSLIRHRGGFNPNPTARMARLSLRHIIASRFLYASNKANVQCVEADTLLQFGGSTENGFMNEDITISEKEQEEEAIIIEDSNDTSVQIDSSDSVPYVELDIYDKNAVRYFAGCIARRTWDKFHCVDCRDLMAKIPMMPITDEENYIDRREYSQENEEEPSIVKLTRPTDLFVDVFATCLTRFQQVKYHYWASRGLLKKIKQECINTCNKTYPQWFSESHSCFLHRIYALEYMLRVKIYSQSRLNNIKTKTGTKCASHSNSAKQNNKKQKLNNLQNK